MRPAVFLDRDGVLNEPRIEGGVPVPPRNVDELVIIAGAAEALTRLKAAGYVLVVVSNQPDVARGTITSGAVDSIHAVLQTQLPLDAVYWCPHDNGDACTCRKPAPGMILDACHDLALDAARSWLIGDRWVDVAAGRSAGVRPVLLEHEHSWAPTSVGPPPGSLRDVPRAETLSGCVELILGASR